MNRVLLAIVGATAATSVVYAVVLGTAMSGAVGSTASLVLLILPGLFWGAGFAVAILLPLWLLLRRSMTAIWLQLGLPAIVLWAAISTVFFASVGLSPFEAVGNALTIFPSGVAAVVTFILMIRGELHA